MSGDAFGAFHSQYSEGGLPIRKADISDIVAMGMHAGRTSTGTGQMVNLQGVYDFVVFFLRNGIVGKGKNRYHSPVLSMPHSACRHGMRMLCVARQRFSWLGELGRCLSICDETHDNNKDTARQSSAGCGELI